MKFNRVFLIVLDSVGIGEAPDAGTFNDIGAHTLGNIATYFNGIDLPNLANLGLGNISSLEGVGPVNQSQAHFTKMQEVSNGKDTLTGHWELMGLKIEKPFKTFPDGFPDRLLSELSERTGRKVIGNKASSGTEIIDELGKEHLETGALIVYTSADSVLQIAAHEGIIPLEELYAICEVARELTLQEKYLLGRVIARPFVGEPGAFVRTSNRHDYALKPADQTVMNTLKDADYDVIALGKINDIFVGEGVTAAKKTISNDDGVEKLLEMMDEDFHGFCFLNLVDFDALYGHRRDPEGYGQALIQFDKQLPEIIGKLAPDDLLIITADHGNDPTHHGTDHTREYVPLLVYHSGIEKGEQLSIRETFADVGATIADNFKVTLPKHGKSFLSSI